jgi:hypothetical protein
MMANSALTLPHRRNFLIMVNAEDAPQGIGTPREPSQWEGQPFRTTVPRKTVRRRPLPPAQIQDPEPGDRLFIWINQTGGGRGLTATAEAAFVEAVNGGLSIRAQNILLLSPSAMNNRTADGLLRPGNVFADIRQSTVAQLRWISEQHAAELDAHTGRISASLRQPGMPEPGDADPPAPSRPLPGSDPASLVAGRQAVMRLIEQRANQGPFRDAIIARDGGRCVVTGSHVRAVLEAAHLIPYASGHSERDNPSNGILLRADIHLLFDRYLMTINPDTMSIVISPRLQNTGYAGLPERRRIRTSAGVEFLRWHYDEFTRIAEMRQE